MKRNAMRKNLRQSIFRSFGRYIAIVAIIALGAGIFVGLLMTRTDMVATGQAYTDAQNMFDLRVLTNYGWTEEYVERFAQLEGIQDAEGTIYLDLIARTGGAEEDYVYRFYSIPENVDKLVLKGGRMPQAAHECLADGFAADETILGQTITIGNNNDEDALDALHYRVFTVVGYVSTPLYMDMNRGTTSVGSGALTNYFFVPQEAFNLDYYTEIHLTIPGAFDIYSDAYNNALEAATDALEPQAEALAEERFQEVKGEIEEEYDEGYQEYLDGLQEYEDGKAEAEQELADAEQELLDAEQELKDSRQQLINAGREIEEGRAQIEEVRSQISNGRAELEAQEAAARPQIEAARAQLDAQYAQLKPAYDQAVAAAPEAQAAIAGIQAQIDAIDPEDPTQSETLAQLQAALSQAQGQYDQLQAAISGMEQVQGGYAQLEAQEQQLAAAKQQLDEAERQMWDGETELNAAYDALMIGWGKFHEGEDELAEGWADYEQAKVDVQQELDDAWAELVDAKQELDEARADIDAMDESELYLLDRNSNVGYYNLEGNADIVQGVSRVFPVFFLLVAALVCITTMTRMIDEERVQIGTLKALGYGNAAIIRKYLIYSGSGALLGCGLGILAGCTIFPQIIWGAYCIMLYIQPNIVLTVDWGLCFGVVVMYTAVLLLVTWYCCRRALAEEPAELIRPKAPDPGKKILLEHLPFWKKISFLNKVAIRNIFRYRQRLAMMLLGIGGCTALLVTGFGLRDSIVNVVDYQFQEVTVYDMEVYFRHGLTQKEMTDFEELVDGQAREVMFFHQSSIELCYDNQVKEVYLLSAGQELTDFVNLHTGDQALDMPGPNEVVLSVGAAEAMDISTGDTVVLRDADLRELTLTVSGIYDNHVYNYAIVAPETVQQQWNETPELQMAYVKAAEGQDVHLLGAAVSDDDSVMNVTISTDVAEMVSGMMDALDSVVVVIVLCAGLLAVTVLYNLTNININERIREIATIKVLGFNASETAAYVFKENMALTVAGTLIGLPFGKLLLIFVMANVKIDMVWFHALLEPRSYVLSVVLTLLSAVVVAFIFFFRLDKINMAEALKSVE